MSEQFITYQKYNDEAMALELTDLLKENGIDFAMDGDTGTMPLNFNKELTQEYRVKLHSQDFAKADALLLSITQRQLSELPSNYYLFDFTDEELIDVIAKPDEWNQLDYLLAQKLLMERGKEVSPVLAEKLRRYRIEELAKPQASQKGMIYSGYALAFLGGFIGVGMGWTLASQKKTLPNGDTVYAYSEADRKHGKRILVIASISCVFWICVRLYVGARHF